MKKGVKWSILLVSLLVVFGGVIWMTNRLVPPTNTNTNENAPTTSESTISVAPLKGYRIPPFSLPSFSDSKPISLADYQGKPMLINFWASWCPPCNDETPDLVKAYAKYGDKVQFIGVNLTASDTLPQATAFLEKYGIKYPVLMDTKGTVGQQYQVISIPTTFFVNRQGIIVDRYVGEITPQILEQDLQRIAQ